MLWLYFVALSFSFFLFFLGVGGWGGARSVAGFWSRELFYSSCAYILRSRAFLLCPVKNLKLINWFCGFAALFKNEQDNCHQNMHSEIFHAQETIAAYVLATKGWKH